MDFRFLGEVCLKSDRFSLRHLALEDLNSIMAVPIMQNEFCAFVSKFPRDGRADSTGCTGNEHHFASKFCIHTATLSLIIRRAPVNPGLCSGIALGRLPKSHTATGSRS